MIATAMHAGHDPRDVREWSLVDLQRFAESLAPAPDVEEDLTDD